MTTVDLAPLLEATTYAAIHAGEMLMDYQQQLNTLQITSKSSEVDLVSAADEQAEDALRQKLHDALPQAGFLGEESADFTPGQAEYIWVVDPLDGTSNFLSGLPIWSVSIALCDAGFDPLLGCVHAPRLGKTWTAGKGTGAWINSSTMNVRSKPPGGGLPNAMIATGFPYDVATNRSDKCIMDFLRMQTRFHKIRRMGSAAIDLAYVAEGLFDGMWESRLKAWDTAAGILLVTEAGGYIQRFDGSPYTPGDPDILAGATAELVEEIRSVLSRK